MEAGSSPVISTKQAEMRHVVRVDTPHIGSLAARVLLTRKLRVEELSSWFEFRNSFLSRILKEQGDLRCRYCGRGGLVMDVPDDAPKSELKQLATIDHVVPRSKGGAERDESNLVVACFPCNQRKADGCRFEGVMGQ